MRKTTFIYVLKDPRSNRVFYVGKSNNPARRKNSSKWSKEVEGRISRIGFRIEPQVVEEVLGKDCWEAEKKWIKYYKQAGMRLLNKNHGGSGVLEHTKEHRRYL